MYKNIEIKAEIVSNEPVADKTFAMKLKGAFDESNRPGCFINISVPGKYLRRPISIFDYEPFANGEGGELTIVYKVVGEGTQIMSELTKGEALDVLQGLGNGFDLSTSGDRPLLVGGGLGGAPLYYAAKLLQRQGKAVTLIMGFNTSAEIFLKNKYEELGCRMIIPTADGSSGVKGFGTDVIRQLDSEEEHTSNGHFFTRYYACGPMPMMKPLMNIAGTNGELSLEARMGCGFGACVGCSIETKKGFKKVCSDGPVFEAGDVLF